MSKVSYMWVGVEVKNSASSDTHSFQSTRVYYIMYSLNYIEY